LAPVYDCGSCLLPQADENKMQRVLEDEDELNSRVYQFPTSAIKQDGRKINYYDFLINLENEECREALIRIVERINMDQINDFIDKVPYISELQKAFYKRYISARYEKIILTAYELAIR
jgi:hypothetical protein